MRFRRYQGPDLAPLWYLLGVNVVLFLVTTASPSIIDRYGLDPSQVVHRPWTMLTSMFLHENFGHILGNMVTLYFFGLALVELTGGSMFLVIYFVGGLIGNLSFALLAPSNSLAIGASGAIFALGGALVSLVPGRKVFMFPIPIPMPLWVAVIGGFLIVSFLPNVAWQAHLGGIVTGLVAGLLLRRTHRTV
jgi:membrane associated rhomboid family serine protease